MLVLAVAAAWFLATRGLGYYELRPEPRSIREEVLGATAAVLVAAVVAQSLAWFGPLAVAAQGASSFIVFFWPAVLISRGVVFRGSLENPALASRVLMVGVGSHAEASASALEQSGQKKVVGFILFTGEIAPGPLARRVVGKVPDLTSAIRRFGATEVFVSPSSAAQQLEVEACAKVCDRLGLRFAVAAVPLPLERAEVVGSHPVVQSYLVFDRADARG